jgi:TatD DNase family protein
MNQIIDTHTHLDYLKDISMDEVIQSAAGLGIEMIITISVEPSNLLTVFEIAQKYQNVYGTQGVHPHEAKHFNDQVKNIIEQNAIHPKIVALGEMGLDYFYLHSTRQEQIATFEAQLELAQKLKMPVVIHSRDAEDDTISILKNFGTTFNRQAVIHSFTGTNKLADFALDQNYFIGVNGIITFKSANALRDIIKNIPVKNLLIETDAPFLAPVPFRGRENNSLYLPHVFNALYELKAHELDRNHLQQILYSNSLEFFSKIKK